LEYCRPPREHGELVTAIPSRSIQSGEVMSTSELLVHSVCPPTSGTGGNIVAIGHLPPDVFTLLHGELRVLSVPARVSRHATPRRAQRLETEGRWTDLPDELLAKVLEADWRSETQEGCLAIFEGGAAGVRSVAGT
jgi:hypothetical protein